MDPNTLIQLEASITGLISRILQQATVGSIPGALGTSGSQKIVKPAHADNSDAYHLELNSPKGSSEGEVSLRFHQDDRFYGQIRMRRNGFHFTQGNDGRYYHLYAGAITSSGMFCNGMFRQAEGVSTGSVNGAQANVWQIDDPGSTRTVSIRNTESVVGSLTYILRMVGNRATNWPANINWADGGRADIRT